MQPVIICVEGLIGAGKTKLLQSVSSTETLHVIQEPVEEFRSMGQYNPLEIMYSNPSETITVQAYIQRVLRKHWEKHLTSNQILLGEHAQVERWLQAQNAYTLHHKIIRKFPRRKFLSKGLHHMWQADLVDMQAIQKKNAGRRYLLTAIDVFSRQAFAKAIRTKKPEEVITAFALILREAGTKPKFLHTDRGTEFTNRKFQNWLDGKNIIHYHTFNNEIKCSLVERWHRTLKNRMFRYFIYKNTLHYLKVLPQLVSAYNHRKHRSLGMAPADITCNNEKVLWERQYGSYLRQRRKRY